MTQDNSTLMRVRHVADHQMIRNGLRTCSMIYDDRAHQLQGRRRPGSSSCGARCLGSLGAFQARRPTCPGSDRTVDEREILNMMACDLKNPEMAGRIGVSTVKTHINHILSELNVIPRTEAVALAYQQGLVDKETL